MTIIKTEKDKKEFIGLITEAFQEVMIPALDNLVIRLKEELASKEDLKNVEHKLSMQIDSLDRKFDARQERLDKHTEL